MIPVVVAVVVLVLIGLLMWKAVSIQPGAGPESTDVDPPTGPTRPQRAVGGRRPSRPRPVAPDDDPEFLRKLDDQLNRPGQDDPPST